MARRKSSKVKKTASELGPPPLLSRGRRRELVGMVLVALSVVTFVALFSQSGALTSGWIGILKAALGRGVVLSPLMLGGLGAWLIWEAVEDRPDMRWEVPVGSTVSALAVLGLLHLASAALSDGRTARMLAETHDGGGWIGFGVAEAFTKGLGTWPAVAGLSVVALFAASLAAGLTVRDTVDLAVRTFSAVTELGLALVTGRGNDALPGSAAHSDEGRESHAVRPAVGSAVPRPEVGAEEVVPARRRPAARAATQWRLPDLAEALDAPTDISASADDAEAMARLIEDSLAEFGVPVSVVEINRGPTITQFGLEPGYVERGGRRSKVKVSRIVALQNDLALSLAASPIRIQAPVPGRPFVGVEVPNAASSLVSLRGVLQSDAFRRVLERGELPIALGRDTSGRPVADDLAAMPHLLVAGATGSGKSVAINAIISTLIVTHTPETLKLILVDPKRVELASFRGLPHLAAPVVVEIERVVGVLQWAVREMDRRYKAFADAGTRNISAFNAAAEGRSDDLMPYIVIIVDELADLMMTVPEEAERLITRLAQLARATGIHLVIATQRPSVDVVTGLIKANFPARIAFAVSSGVDSRVILDSAGAEKLLGRGDMLYQASDSSKLRRLQGCFVSDGEIERLVRYWKRSGRRDGPSADTEMTLGLPEPLIQPELWEEMAEAASRSSGPEHDALWEEAVALIREHNTASTSFLQRKLRIGYARAARIIDQLEEAGWVGPAHGNQPREVLAAPSDEAAEESPRAQDSPGSPAPSAMNDGDVTEWSLGTE